MDSSGQRTDTLELPRHEAHNGFRVFAICRILLENLLQTGQSLAERVQHFLRVRPRLGHVKHDLLYHVSVNTNDHPPCEDDKIGYELTRMPTIWQYVAGVSRLLPMVKKKRLSSAKTSDKMVSTRFGSGCGWDLVDEDAPLPMVDDCEICSSRIELSFVTVLNVRAGLLTLLQHGHGSVEGRNGKKTDPA